MPIAAEFLTTTAALEDLRPEWEQLWARAPQATPFQSPQWLLPWWKHVARGTLATVAVRCAAGELAALAPLYIDVDTATRRRRLFPIGIATTDYLDVLVKAGWEEHAVSFVLSQLMRREDDWDVLEVPRLRPDAPLLRAAAPAGWRRDVFDDAPSPVLMLQGLQGNSLPIPESMAQNLRYCRRRAARIGALTYETADAQTIPRFLDALAHLHARRWCERGSPGVLDDPSVLAAHREAAPLLHAAGLLRLHALRLDGEFIAVLYCLFDAAPLHERRYYYYLGGFEPRRRALSPGTLLIAHAIENAVAQGATAFDFLRGAEAYKYRWGAIDQPMFTLRWWKER
jgi:CelD/BcsL family acetyltransferase involved in cellulose biosynthesis